jgi:hypothetical protein
MRQQINSRIPGHRHQMSLVVLFSITASALGTTLASSAGATEALVIDRFGNRHDLSAIRIKDRTELEYYVGDERRKASFDHIQKFVVDGATGDEERPVKVHLRSGRVDAGMLFTGGQESSANQGFNASSSGGRAPTGVSGKTSLGPWLLSLDDVREVRFQHPEGEPAPAERPALKAAVVTTKGALFEVADLLLAKKQILRYSQNRRKMTLDLAKIERIQFAEYSSGQEDRQITITLWGGTAVHGSVNATVARYTGETDKQYARRVGAAVTGNMAEGLFSAGMHEIKLIRFHPIATEAAGATGANSSPSPAAD